MSKTAKRGLPPKLRETAIKFNTGAWTPLWKKEELDAARRCGDDGDYSVAEQDDGKVVYTFD